MPTSGMTHGSGKSRFAGRAAVCACAALFAAALAAPAADAQSAVDEYTLTLPQASGDQHIPPGAGAGTAPGDPTAAPAPPAPDEGSPTDLDSPQGGGLAKQLATDQSLGAPPKYEKHPGALGTSGRGVPEIVADTVDEGEGGAPALLALIGAIAAAGVWLALRRRRANLHPAG